MKGVRLILLSALILLVTSCGEKPKKPILPLKNLRGETTLTNIPLDKGFSEYIAGYTSGIVHSNSVIEIRFTPEFAAKADKSVSNLFSFQPTIKGKSEWKDATTLIFTPSKVLDQGKIFTGEFALGKLGPVQERLKIFPLRIQTVKKEFKVKINSLVCSEEKADNYLLQGEVVTSDYTDNAEVENYIEAKLGRRKAEITWEHPSDVIHKFTISEIERTDKIQELTVSWDGGKGGLKQKGSTVVNIPPAGEFSVLDAVKVPGEGERIDVIFSDPPDPEQETNGLYWFDPSVELTVNLNSNIASIYPASGLDGKVLLTVESQIKNMKGIPLKSSFSKVLDFTTVPPKISMEGFGVILPSSQNLIFPFKAANLKAVDLRIIKIFDNNLPGFLQENDIDGGYSLNRFGRPVYSGKVELNAGDGSDQKGWNLYTIDLADYIDVEPGVLYKVYLSMRKSYSLYPCSDVEAKSQYEEKLDLAEELNKEMWDDPDNYYTDISDEIYYQSGFSWEDRDDPCKDAYFSPDKRASRNVLASNLGIIAKKGEDNLLHVSVNDILTALPVSEASVEVYDYQMQLISTGTTSTEGSVAIGCKRKPFLVTAKKDKDRNYLKTNDGSALSLSSFDVAGSKPEKGIKAFIYGERDVWRPGDSIYLAVFIKDMKNDLPAGHPVQFELLNPLEQRVDNQVRKAEGSNLLLFTTKTTEDAITGNYRAVFKIGGATFTKRVRIETIKPNRLKLLLNFRDEILGGSAGASHGTLNVKWLNGSVARNMKSSVEYILKPAKTEFEKFGQYIFDDPVSEFYAETESVFDDATDANGNAEIYFNPGKDLKAPGMLNAVFTVKSREPGGDESVTQATYKYAPYPVFAGINLPGLKGKSRMLFTDTENEVKIVTVDEKGKPVRSEVEVSVYKISYLWWWESDEENLGYYISNNIYKPVVKKTLNTAGGEISFKFKIDKKEWGRYLIRATTPQGHSTGKIVLIDWPWEYGMKGNSDGATLLSVSTDKEKYNPGDEVKLSFPSPENARAIISLENSTGVVEELYANCQKGNTEVIFRAKPEMAPNVYAYVTVIQPHAQTLNDMPVRLYGVVPVMVEDKDTRLKPEISMPDEVRSQQPFEVKVNEADKKPMTYTLAVVDDGLLDLTGYKTPDPWNYFYAREALGVQTWDLYDFILGAFGGTLDRIFAVGGDITIDDKAASKARRFPPVVRYLGPFNLEPGKTNKHIITLPQYTGSVRTMVIAGSDRSFGFAEKTVQVKDPLMVLVTAPRVVSPGERVALPVTLFIQKNGIKNVVVKAESDGKVTFDKQSIEIPVSGTGEVNGEFIFNAGETRGFSSIKITASGGGETAKYDLSLEIRTPNPQETRSEVKLLKAGEKWETSFVPFGMAGTDTAIAEASVLPSINLEKRSEYLINYPHGCSEQIVSSAFPQLWLNGTETTATNITAAINMLISRQMTTGGIALWPGSAQPDNWVTSYATQFVIEAERKGYVIPSGFRQKLLAFQKKSSQEWRPDQRYMQTANDQAYRLFTLALAGQAEKGAMNRLRETPGIPLLSKWLLAASFAATGRNEASEELIDLRETNTEPQYANYYYGSEMRDKAIMLYTLSLMKKEEQAASLLKEICDNFSSDNWYSTQTTAWGIVAYMKWTESIQAGNSQDAKISATINGQKKEQTISSKQKWTAGIKVLRGNNQLAFENLSDKPLYVILTRKGIPLVSEKQGEEKGLSIKTDYLTMDLKPVDQKNLVQGTDFMMLVKVSNTTFSEVDNIALTEMVPSGWEIQNTRMFEANYGIKEGSYDYRDFRDDRVNTYFSLGRGETKTFVLILSAAYKGEFYQPPVWCEAMYTNNCYAGTSGNKVRVTGE